MDLSITAEVVNFLLRKDPVPVSVKRATVDHIIDGIGLMLAGSRTSCIKILTDFTRKQSDRGACTIIGSNTKSSSVAAALVNGASGHADDYDDTQLSTSPDRIYGLLTHPTVPVLAASLSVAEEMNSTGKDLLEHSSRASRWSASLPRR